MVDAVHEAHLKAIPAKNIANHLQKLTFWDRLLCLESNCTPKVVRRDIVDAESPSKQLLENVVERCFLELYREFFLRIESYRASQLNVGGVFTNYRFIGRIFDALAQRTDIAHNSHTA